MTHIFSRFSTYAYATGFGALAGPIGTIIIFIYFFQDQQMKKVLQEIPFFMIIFPLSILASFIFWMVVIRKWLLKVEITDYSIKGRDTFGKGTLKEKLFQELDGYSIKTRRMKNQGDVEQLIIWQHGKKVFILVAPVFSNYDELKTAITSKLRLIESA